MLVFNSPWYLLLLLLLPPDVVVQLPQPERAGPMAADDGAGVCARSCCC